MILDEPTEGIQPNIVRDISDVIRKLNSELGLTVLLVEQKLPSPAAPPMISLSWNVAGWSPMAQWTLWMIG